MSAAGANIWATADSFHFVWKKVSGDVSLTADIDFPVKTANAPPHRKAVLMLRQDLAPDSAYADAAFHGSGLTALQFRHIKGGISQDIELNTTSGSRFRIEKRGDNVTLFVSFPSEPLHQVGSSTRVHLSGDFYLGLGVCAHNASVPEKAVFSKVESKSLTRVPLPRSTVRCRQCLSTQARAVEVWFTRCRAGSRHPTGPEMEKS